MDWLYLFVYTFGAISIFSAIVFGVLIIRIMWRSMHGKMVKANEIKLAGWSIALCVSLSIFLFVFAFSYPESISTIFLGFIGSILVWIVVNIIFQKILDAFALNSMEAYNKMRSDGLL